MMNREEKRALQYPDRLTKNRHSNPAPPADANSESQKTQDSLDLATYRGKEISVLKATIASRDHQIAQLKLDNSALEVRIAHLTGKINPSARAILLTGFKRLPLFKFVLNKIRGGSVYSIQRFSIKIDGKQDYLVIVAFVNAASAYAFMKLNCDLTIGADHVSVIYDSIPKHIPEFVSERVPKFPIRLNVLDHPGNFTRIIAIWKPKWNLPRSYIENVQYNHNSMFEDKHNFITNPQEISGYRTPSEIQYAQYMGFSSFDPEQVIEVDQIVRRRMPGRPSDSHLGLKIEYTSIEACMTGLRDMKENDDFKDCLYEVLQDYCEKDKHALVKGVTRAHPIQTFNFGGPQSPPRSLPIQRVSPSGDVHEAARNDSQPYDVQAFSSKYSTPAQLAVTHTTGSMSWECFNCGSDTHGTQDTCLACQRPRTAKPTVIANKEPSLDLPSNQAEDDFWLI